MPELASYSFHLFYYFFGKHNKSSVLSLKFCFGKKYAIERRFSSDFTAISFGRIDQMNKSRVFSRLQCRYISPERFINWWLFAFGIFHF